MKKLIVLYILLCGCGNVDQQFRAAVKTNWAAIRPEYVAYVAADAQLNADEKSIKLTTVELFNNLLKEAKDD